MAVTLWPGSEGSPGNCSKTAKAECCAAVQPNCAYSPKRSLVGCTDERCSRPLIIMTTKKLHGKRQVIYHR